MVARSKDTIRDAAQQLRQRLGVEGEYAPDMVYVLRKLEKLSPKTTMVLVSDSELPLMEARADPEKRTITIKTSVFDNLKLAEPHARWMVAHELGHLILHHKGAKYRSTNKSFVVSVEKQQELEAQMFAAAFLLPAELASTFESAKEIAQRFHVTLEAAKVRLEAFERSDANRALAPDYIASRLGLFSISNLPPTPSFRAPAAAVTSLREQGYSEEEIFEFVVPKRTLARRRAASELLTVDETDRALRLKRIGLQAQNVFGNAEKASRWLRKPKRELKGETPLAYLASEAGARVVEEMLYRIEHGIFA